MNINLLCDKILHIISDYNYYTAAVSVCKMLTVLCFEQKKIARSIFSHNIRTDSCESLFSTMNVIKLKQRRMKHWKSVSATVYVQLKRINFPPDNK